MGFHVSTLHNLPVGGIQYFIHVLDMSGGEHAQWINENLHRLAATLGRDSGLVSGPADLSEELYQFLMRNLPDHFGTIEGLLHSSTCLLISEGHLAHTQKPVFLMPIAMPAASDEARELISALIAMIAAAIRSNTLQDLVQTLGAHKFELATVGGGFFVCNLRRLNKVLELKPNISGLGVNLNGAIEAYLPPATRRI